MRRTFSLVFIAALIASVLFIASRKILAQGNIAPSLVTRAPDDSQRFTLRGNVHPLARAEYDQGAASSTMQMGHMFLVLRRSAQQQAALDTLDAQQADKNSPNYHHWLTPAEFGEQFGASDSDVTEITTWLGSHGFQIAAVSLGRNMIDFTGTVGEVQEAFHTQIHQYIVNGATHFANATDPQIPSAFASAVVGINSLNDFHPRPMSHTFGAFKMSLADHKITAALRPTPNLTSVGAGCYNTSTTTGTNCYTVAPYDFATIYNTLPLWNSNITGTGEAIAIVSDSNVNSADYTQFRTLTGLPAQTVNVRLATGVNPGLQMCTVNTDEQESILDVEWAGAVAPSAAIDLVIAPSAQSVDCNTAATTGEGAIPPTGYTSNFGGDYAAYYAINTLNDPILSDSFGLCELQLGSSGNSFYNALWQQAATQGITVLTATGDNGAAGCDSDTSGNPASDGLQVNGTASTPFATAVGGTDFNYTSQSGAQTYWNSSNSASGTATTFSVKGPIPESVYNDSCTNPEFFSILGVSNVTASCDSLAAAQDGIVEAAGSSGGLSACTAPTGLAATDCAGGYAKPSYQTALTSADSHRDIPDVSLFAGDGTASGTFYLVCQEDAFILSNPPVQPTACNITQGSYFFAGVGGTSASAQAFAGIVALIDQKSGHREGNINTQLYSLAGAETFANCNNSSSTPLANSSTCIFKDITTGTNAAPCVVNSTNCGTSITSSNVAPFVGPDTLFRWTPLSIGLALSSLLAIILTFRFMPIKQHRWSAAFAIFMLAIVLTSVSCGGGSGSGGGGTTNTVGVTSGYNAAVGYDRATGLGTVNAANLANAAGW